MADLKIKLGEAKVSGEINTICKGVTLVFDDASFDFVDDGNFCSQKQIRITREGGGNGLDTVLEDLTPQLGGDLDLNNNDILGNGNVNITGDITATGDGQFGDILITANTITSTNNGDIILDASGTGTTVIEGNTYPNTAGTNGQVLTTNGAGVLTWEDPEIGWGTDTFTISDGSNTSIISSNEIVTIQSGTNTTVILDPSTNTYSIDAVSGITEVLEDLTPQLGGNLDLNNNDISGNGNINITGDITATGDGQFGDILIAANTITNVNNGDIILDTTGTATTVIVSRVNTGKIISVRNIDGVIETEQFAVNNIGSVTFPSRATDPAAPTAGDVYFNTTTSKLRAFDGSIWNDLF